MVCEAMSSSSFGCVSPFMCSRHGPRERWRDVVAADTALLGVDDWYSAAQKRREWSALIKDIDPPPAQPKTFKCRCGREFRRSGDIKRHQ